MNLIELHIIQSFPVTCLNRDDLGAPKSALFGGVQRARVSSQSWKRAIREQLKEVSNGGSHFQGKRTRFVLGQLKNEFVRQGVDEEQAAVLAKRLGEALGKLDDPEKGNVKTLLFFSPQEIANVSAALLDSDISDPLDTLTSDAPEKDKNKARQEIDKAAKKAAKSLGNAVKDAADIAIFGRMVADDHSLMVEGAGLFSHALSTHKVSNEVDFFSAVDDLRPDDAEGASHIGTLEFNSACYYRYIGLNVDLLFDSHHLAHFETKELRRVLDSFLRASILAVPNARKNSMFGFTLPSYVLGLKRTGQPLSLVNAFEAGVRPSSTGFISPSIKALNDHLDELTATYGAECEVKKAIPEVSLEELISELTELDGDE